MDNNGNYNYNGEVKKASFGWAVLGFFIPLIGIILFAVWNKTEPEKAKNAGIGALVGFLFSFIAPFIFAAILVSGISNGKIEKFINKMNCLDFGTNYEPYEIDGEWYCKNNVNGKVMNPNTGKEYCQNGDCEDNEIEKDFEETYNKTTEKIKEIEKKINDNNTLTDDNDEDYKCAEDEDEEEPNYLTEVDYKLKYNVSIDSKAKIYTTDDNILELLTEGKKFIYDEEKNNYVTLSNGVAIVHNHSKDYKTKINNIEKIYILDSGDGYRSEFALLTKDGDIYLGPSLIDYGYEYCLNYKAMDSIKKVVSNNKYKDINLVLFNYKYYENEYDGDTLPYEFVGITTDGKMDLLD